MLAEQKSPQWYDKQRTLTENLLTGPGARLAEQGVELEGRTQPQLGDETYGGVICTERVHLGLSEVACVEGCPHVTSGVAFIR